MPKRGKRYLDAKKKLTGPAGSGSGTAEEAASLPTAIEKAVSAASARFDETLEIAVRLGVDPRHADQMVRGTVILPHGTGKTVTVAVFAKGEKEAEARDAGADVVGNDELIEKIKGGWTDFDAAVATPDMMGSVGKIGRILGPRGLMPNAKTGTVTFDIAKAVKELKAGKIEFRVEKAGIVHAALGKVSFGPERLRENATAFLDAVNRLRPAASKGAYFRGISVATTMGPGIRADTASLRELGVG